MQADETITGKLWTGCDTDYEWTIEGELRYVYVERTDHDEIRIAAGENGVDDATIYLTTEQALKVMALLGSAIVERENTRV